MMCDCHQAVTHSLSVSHSPVLTVLLSAGQYHNVRTSRVNNERSDVRTGTESSEVGMQSAEIDTDDSRPLHNDTFKWYIIDYV